MCTRIPLFAMLWLVLLSVMSSSSSAGQYSYVSGFTKGLGQGFDPALPYTSFPPCLVPRDKTNDPAKLIKVASFGFATTLVTDSEMLYKALGIDAKLEANSVLIGGNLGAEANFSEQFASNSNDVYWTLKVTQLFTPIDLGFVDLTPDAEALRKTPEELYRHCGHEWVARETRGVMLLAVFSSKDLSLETSQALKASFHASAGNVIGGFSLDTSFRSFLADAVKHNSVELNIYGVGGGGIEKLGGLAVTPSNVADVEGVLKTYVEKSMTAANAAPLFFETADFASLTQPPQASPSETLPDQLTAIYTEFLDTHEKFRRIQAILNNLGTVYGYLAPEDRAQLRSAAQHLSKREADLRIEAKACSDHPADPNACPEILADDLIIDWPENPEPHCTKWKSTTCQQCEFDASFKSKTSGDLVSFGCSHMPATEKMEGKFLGYVISDDNAPWPGPLNTSIKLDLKKPGASCAGCVVSATHVVQKENTPIRQWTKLCLVGQGITSADGVGEVTIAVSACKHRMLESRENTTCATAPPAQGKEAPPAVAPYPIDWVGRGFPIQEKDKPGRATVVVRAIGDKERSNCE